MGSFLAFGGFLALEQIGAGFFAAMQTALVLLNTPPSNAQLREGIAVGVRRVMYAGIFAHWIDRELAGHTKCRTDFPDREPDRSDLGLLDLARDNSPSDAPFIHRLI